MYEQMCIERSVTGTKLPELLRQRPNARVLSALLLTRWETFVHTTALKGTPGEFERLFV
jgi:hypothetical protein